MKNKILLLSIGASIITSFNLYADNNKRLWDSDVVEDYLNPKKGSTVASPLLTDLKKDSRWYATFRVKGGYYNQDTLHREYIQGNARLRGKTYFTEKAAVIGDFWFKAQENYSRRDGVTVQKFNDFDDQVLWEQYRFGIEHDDYGAFMFGKHTATWSFFSVDMGSQGLMDTQADAGGKNAGKFLYKKHFDSNLFLSGSYDRVSKISGIDVGYQTADVYSFRPNDYGIYASMHNGQPMVSMGSKAIVGNVDISNTRLGNLKNSDSAYAREDTHLYTYSLSGYKNISNKYRVVGQTAWSKRDDSESIKEIRERGWAKKGLGYSGTVGIQTIPENYKGFSYIMYNSWDEIGHTSITPQVEYWFGGGLRAWVSWTWEEIADDITRVEFQWDF